MPLLIAHRGLVDGPDRFKENSLTALLSARSQGFDVEVDVWYDNYNFYVGHDDPMWQADIETLKSIGNVENDPTSHIWIHCKNINALAAFQELSSFRCNYFFHENDPITLTNNGYVWTFPGKQLTSNSICVMPEWTYSLKEISAMYSYGFCSDYVSTLKDIFEPVMSRPSNTTWRS